MRILVAGALGEVGSTVASALVPMGHDVVPASSRAPLTSSEAVSLTRAAELIAEGSVDLVLNAAGRGDRRDTDRSGLSATEVLAPVCASMDVPSVLISTTRVLEGYDADVDEDADPRPTTPYARANAANERAWLDHGGPHASVLRITNYFCAPSSPTSPQALLLPWSLVTEALTTGAIVVRSGPSTTREFVGAHDVATAALRLAQSPPEGRVCATAPGARLSLADLVRSVDSALEALGRPVPASSFGPDGPSGPVCRPGWLAEHGWTGTLDAVEVTRVITEWVRSVRLN